MAAKKKPQSGKKLLKARLRERGAELVKKYKKAAPRLRCPLCGEAVERGGILQHKADSHGEKPVVSSPPMPHNSNRWVSIYCGGLPSLGKRSK